MRNKQTKWIVSSAVAGLMSMSVASFADSKTPKAADHKPVVKEGSGECWGINSCKGKGECGGKGHSCAGQNECKGKGWITKTESECKKLKGTFKAG